MSPPGRFAPLIVHLDLSELAELNTVLEHARSGMIARGAAFDKNPKRVQKILALVQGLFKPLGASVQIKLGNGTGSQRFLMAAFAWGHDPDVGGVSAQGLSRSKLGKFNKMTADQSKPVTGYIFEGVIGNWMVDYLGGKAANLNHVFATICAHELGHQLGLGHETSQNDIMFEFGGRTRGHKMTWLQKAERLSLQFSKPQIVTMQKLLATP